MIGAAACLAVACLVWWFDATRASHELRAWAADIGVEPRWLESRRSLRRRVEQAYGRRQ